MEGRINLACCAQRSLPGENTGTGSFECTIGKNYPPDKQMTKIWTQEAQLLRTGITNRGINLHVKLYPSSLLRSNMGAKPFKTLEGSSCTLKKNRCKAFSILLQQLLFKKNSKKISYIESWLCYSADLFFSSWQQHHSLCCWRDSLCCDHLFYKSCEWHKARILFISAFCFLQGEKIHRFLLWPPKLPPCRLPLRSSLHTVLASSNGIFKGTSGASLLG